jgi:NitT/TauT family transport system ATP-binding protein
VYVADEILLLSRAPTRVADFIGFDAPRPRTDATLSDPTFVRVKAHALAVFQREVRR